MDVLLVAILLSLLVIFILDKFFRSKKEYSNLKRNVQFVSSLPGPPMSLFIYDMLQVACNRKNQLDQLMEYAAKYKTPSRMLIGPDIYVILARPEDYKIVLMNARGTNKNSVTKMWKVYLGEGILRVSGAAHKLRRKLIVNSMKAEYLFDYVSLFDKCSKRCADNLNKEIDGGTFDITLHVARFATDIFLETIIGIEGTAHKGKYDELWYKQKEFMKQIYNRIVQPWLHPKFLFSLTKSAKHMSDGEKIVRGFINRVMSEKSTNINNHNDSMCESLQESREPISVYYNYLHFAHLHEDANKFNEVSDQDFKDDICNLFAALLNTITESACFILLMLATHPNVQEKLRQEIFSTFNDDEIDGKLLTSMPYFNTVYKETLRLFPVAYSIARQLTEDIQLESCVLPTGCNVLIPVFTIHRDPEYWQNPEEFIPERFASENFKKSSSDIYMPFGTGPRNCLGQKYAMSAIATLIVNLLRRYRFASTENTKDIKLTHDILLRPLNGTKISIVCDSFDTSVK